MSSGYYRARAMPIRPELRPLYPPRWRELSARVRFARAGGRCQGCGRPHLASVRCLPDGRWWDAAARTWRGRQGRPARWPDLVELTRHRTTRAVLAAAHLNHDPADNRLRNLRACTTDARPSPGLRAESLPALLPDVCPISPGLDAKRPSPCGITNPATK